MPFGKSVMTVAAILRRGGDVLAVRESRLGVEAWGLPGGVVEPGELLTEALVREVREETGLRVMKIAALAVVSQHYIPAFEDALTSFAFEVAEFDGDLRVQDPDGLVQDVAWIARDDLVADLGRGLFAPGRDPMIEYLRDPADATRAWFWRISEDEAVPTAKI